MTTALLVIDPQNDYNTDGKFPLFNMEQTIQNIISAIHNAQSKNMPIIFIQHIADPQAGIAPFFNQGDKGAEIIPEILAAAPNADVVIKHYADSFYETKLEETLAKYNVDSLLVCGMMTQNCVNHTVLSRTADKYKQVQVVADCCTTVTEMIHLIALHAISTRTTFVEYKNI